MSLFFSISFSSLTDYSLASDFLSSFTSLRADYCLAPFCLLLESTQVRDHFLLLTKSDMLLLPENWPVKLVAYCHPSWS
jgi:hypothetical protein